MFEIESEFKNQKEKWKAKIEKIIKKRKELASIQKLNNLISELEQRKTSLLAKEQLAKQKKDLVCLRERQILAKKTEFGERLRHLSSKASRLDDEAKVIDRNFLILTSFKK